MSNQIEEASGVYIWIYFGKVITALACYMCILVNITNYAYVMIPGDNDSLNNDKYLC